MLDRLTTTGFLPKELPPCFVSDSLAAVNWDQIADVPTKSVSLALGRPGHVRRALAIPNPLAFGRLAQEVARSWQTIEPKTTSPFSQSAPTTDPKGRRALVSRNKLSALPEIRAELRAAASWLVFADVSECYKSLYTHSIAWALHSKAVAKAKRGEKSLLGNILDSRVQNLQDRQTNGVPVGPDTSLVVAELVLSAVDDELLRRVPGARGIRFYDDYEFACDSRDEAESMLTHLQSSLLGVGLSLNPSKTRIVEAPEALDSSWTTPMRTFKANPASKHSMLAFYELVLEQKRRLPGAAIIDYALGRMRRLIGQDTAAFLLNLAMPLVFAEPSAAPALFKLVVKAKDQGFPIDDDSVENFVLRYIESAATRGLAVETCWALWMCVLLDIKLGQKTIAAAESIGDCCVQVLLCEARDAKLITGKLDVANWVEADADAGSRDHHWLLVYQAAVRGWKDILAAKTFGNDFDKLLLSKVDFVVFPDLNSDLVETVEGDEDRYEGDADEDDEEEDRDYDTDDEVNEPDDPDEDGDDGES